jgi:hypothetical protein
VHSDSELVVALSPDTEFHFVAIVPRDVEPLNGADERRVEAVPAKVTGDDLALQGQLRRDGERLQAASTTPLAQHIAMAEMRAARSDPVDGRRDDPVNDCTNLVSTAFDDARLDSIAGYGTIQGKDEPTRLLFVGDARMQLGHTVALRIDPDDIEDKPVVGARRVVKVRYRLVHGAGMSCADDRDKHAFDHRGVSFDIGGGVRVRA